MITAEEIRKIKAPAMTSNGGRTYHREDIQEGSQLWFLREILAQLVEINQPLGICNMNNTPHTQTCGCIDWAAQSQKGVL